MYRRLAFLFLTTFAITVLSAQADGQPSSSTSGSPDLKYREALALIEQNDTYKGLDLCDVTFATTNEISRRFAIKMFGKKPEETTLADINAWADEFESEDAKAKLRERMLDNSVRIGDLLRASADSGHAAAQHLWGCMLLQNGLKTKSPVAIGYLTNAADAGYVDSMIVLAKIYASGHFAPKNIELASQWFTKAAFAIRDGDELWKIANKYEHGIGVTAEQKLATELVVIAAQLGSRVAQWDLATKFEKGIHLEKNLVEAEKWYVEAARQDYGPMQFELAEKYLRGQGIRKSSEEAFYWYKQAADQDLELCAAEGRCHQLGLETLQEAVTKANHKVGLYYMAGMDPVEQNYNRATLSFVRAAKFGFAGSQYFLGLLYAGGLIETEGGRERGRLLGEVSLLNAAKQGYLDAYGALFDVYMDNKQEDLAFRWAEAAALQGHPKSQFNLGVFYDLRKGTRKDELNAFAWMTIASRHAEQATDATEQLDKMRRLMTTRQIRKALKLVEQIEQQVADQ